MEGFLSPSPEPFQRPKEDLLRGLLHTLDGGDQQALEVVALAAEAGRVAPDQVDMANVEAFYMLDGTYIDGTLERAIEEFGSMEGYIREGLGISDEEIQLLRAELLR